MQSGPLARHAAGGAVGSAQDIDPGDAAAGDVEGRAVRRRRDRHRQTRRDRDAAPARLRRLRAPLEPHLGLHAFMLLQDPDHLEQVARLRIAALAQHPHQALRRLAR